MELEVLNNKLNTQLDERLFDMLVAQIQKDTMMSGVDYDFSELTPQQLLNALYEIVEELLSKEYGTLLNLFYRMDIPESAIKSDEHEDLQAHLVDLIVKREFLKVKMRQEYS